MVRSMTALVCGLGLVLGSTSTALAVCGDNVLDLGEQCDDGNVLAGDCCSPTCQFEALGSPCTSDGNPCTDDVCDAAGTCLHPNNVAACDDGNPCTSPDTCVAGACTGAGDPNCGIALDHFKCYATVTRRGATPFLQRTVTLADQFGQSTTLVKRPAFLCNPVDKNGEGIHDATAHLTCHRTKDASSTFVQRDVLIRNQFGDQMVRVQKPLQLCLPSEKDGVPSTLQIDHFRCYKARLIGGSTFVERDVTLADQFENKPARIRGCLRLCAPVDKNGEGIMDGVPHLMCYRLTDLSGQPFVRRQVTAHHQFGDEPLDVRGRPILCVPSLKNP